MKTDRHTTLSQNQTPSQYAKPTCPYDKSKDGCYNYNYGHRNTWFHTYTPPSPRDIITKWIKSEKDDMNLNQLIFGININDTTNKSKIFKRFIRYIVIHIKDYPNPVDKESIKHLLHRLQEDAIDYPIKVNNDEDKEFYKALNEMGFDEKKNDDDSNVIEFHGFELMFKI